MRKTEITLGTLFKIEIQDYIDNGHASLPTLIVSLKHLKVLEERSAERIRPGDIEEYKQARKATGAANATINLELAVLRRAFALGLERELIKKAPHVKLFSVGKKNRRTGFFEHSDYEKQLRVLPLWQAQCLRFAYICGWRESELFGLTWADNFVADPPTLRVFKTKNKEWRVLPLSDEYDRSTALHEIIMEQRAAQNGPYIFHYEGRRIKRSTFNKYWRRACKESGVDKHFHDLRRTASRNLRNAGVDQVDRMAIIGHRTTSMDLRYGIVSEDDIKNSMNKLATYMRKRKKPSNSGSNNGSCVPPPGLEGFINPEECGDDRATKAFLPRWVNTICNHFFTSKPVRFLGNLIGKIKNKCLISVITL